MPITNLAIKNAEPREKPYRLSAGNGLYLEVSPTGGKLWRYKYRFGRKEKRLALGKYPDVSLSDARKAAYEARALREAGTDPAIAKRARKAAEGSAGDSFEVVAREWFGKHEASWAESHGSRVLSRLERYVFPAIGRLPIAEVDAPLLRTVLDRIEQQGTVETAHRVLNYLGRIGKYSIATGRTRHNPASTLVGSLKAVTTRHMAAVTDPTRLGQLLRLTDAYPGGFVVACALKLAPRVFVRPGELRKAQWADVNLDEAQWSFVASKTTGALIVPLARQCVDVLRDLHGVTGHNVYLFPSARSSARPMSENAILAALRSLNIGRDDMTGHGFRASARTILDEVLGFPPEIIEAQLGHKVVGPLGRAYNRTKYLPQRVAMMQRWADYLDGIKATS